MQAQQRIIWGQALQTQKAIRRKGQDNRMRLVPHDWELVRLDGEGNASKLADHVMAFDVSPTGQIVYSDGSGVYALTSQGEVQLSSVANAEQIAIL